MNQGWIKVHRKIMESPVWNEPAYLKLWMYCLLKASHKKREILLGNQIIEVGPGQFVTGRKSLSNALNNEMNPEFQRSDATWWRYLLNLEKWQMLNIKKTNKYSVISIINWHEYQNDEQQMNNKCTTDEQQLNTNKNVKNVKNDNTSRSKLKFETSHFELAEHFYNQILKNNSQYKKPNLEAWANDIRLMVERDGRTEEQIKYLMEWVQQDDFEMTNVLSPSKLRKRFDQLVMKVKKEKQSTSNNVHHIKQFRPDSVEITEDDYY